MHRLEVTGETPEALYTNALQLLSLLVRGGQVMTTAAQTAPSSNGKTAEESGDAGSQNAGSNPVGADQPETTGRKRAPRAKPADKSADKLNDPIPDLTGGVTVEHDADEFKKALTLEDDIRPRLREIQKKAVERGVTMPDAVKYIQKLYGPFGIQKADQLKPEQFAEFMEASDGYLSGEA